jgi:hypothetical protein
MAVPSVAVGVAFLAAWSVNADAATWVEIVGDAETSMAMDVDSIRTVENFPDMLRAWFRFTHRKARDCSPPTGCRATVDYAYYYSNCRAETIGLVQGQSLDEFGKTVASYNTQAFMAVQLSPVPDSWNDQAMRRLCHQARSGSGPPDPSSLRSTPPAWIKEIAPPSSK